MDEFLAVCLKVSVFTGCLALTIGAVAGAIYAVRCAYRAIVEIKLAHKAKYYVEQAYKETHETLSTPQYNTTYRDAHKKRGKKLRGILHTEEHKGKISDGLRAYYANNESKSKGRVSENRKGVILREHSDDPPLYFASVHEADAYLGGGCRANITRAIRRGGVVKGYYAEWAKMDGERRDGNAADN